MLTKVQKWGNSLGLRIPSSFAADARVVRPARRKKYGLKDLLKGVTKRNLHGEISSGDPLGREAW